MQKPFVIYQSHIIYLFSNGYKLKKQISNDNSVYFITPAYKWLLCLQHISA